MNQPHTTAKPAACAECPHSADVHTERGEPVSVGQCTACPDGEDWHDYQPAASTVVPSADQTAPAPMPFTYTDSSGDRLTAEPATGLDGLPVVALIAEQYRDVACVHLPLDQVESLIAALGAVLPSAPTRTDPAAAEDQPETPLEKRLRYSERRIGELRAECRRRGKIKLEQAERIIALERQVDEIHTQLGAEILRAGQAEAELRRLADETATTQTGCWCGHPEDRHWTGATNMPFSDGGHDCRGWNGAHSYGQELPWLPEGDEPAAGARQDGAQR